MKKTIMGIVAILITIVLVFMAIACSGKTAEKPPVTTPPTTTPPTTTTTPPATTPPATTTSVATLIPHSLDGRDQCLVCHQTGLAGATAVPADHTGRTNTICTTCHKVK